MIQAACEAIDRASADGLQPVTADARFEQVYRLTDLRSIALQQKLDLGFDPGPERFATFLGLRLCRGVLGQLPTVVAAARRFATQSARGRHNFYLDPNTFPNDVDTTSMTSAGAFEGNVSDASALVGSARELLHALYLEENIKAVRYLPIPSNHGVVMVYWMDRGELPTFFRRPQFDAAVALNALYAVHLAAEHGFDASPFATTWHYVQQHLVSGRYRKGTLYYPSPDSFLCLLGMLCARFPKLMDGTLAAAWQQALTERAADATNDPVLDPESALNRAQRIVSADALDIASKRNTSTEVEQMKHELATQQGKDGLWDVGALYGYGPAPFFIGSRELTAAYAIAALGRTWLGH